MRFKKLDLNLLVALDHLITLKSVSAAADRMFMSQSAMSNALKRLREYFDDPLLVQVGKRMEVTPRAETMHEAIREILVRIEATIDNNPSFDPSVSTREFNVLVSDFTLRVLIPKVLAEMDRQAAQVKLNLLMQSSSPHIMLERGDADLLICPAEFVSQDHPSTRLFEDEFVAIVCAKGPHAGQQMDLARYRSGAHALMLPPNTSGMATPVEEKYLEAAGITRNISLTCFSFSALPHLISGTNRIATVHRKLAKLTQAAADLEIKPLPFELPRFRQMMQWHAYRDQDPGIGWLRSVFQQAATRLH